MLHRYSFTKNLKWRQFGWSTIHTWWIPGCFYTCMDRPNREHQNREQKEAEKRTEAGGRVFSRLFMYLRKKRKKKVQIYPPLCLIGGRNLGDEALRNQNGNMCRERERRSKEGLDYTCSRIKNKTELEHLPPSPLPPTPQLPHSHFFLSLFC